MIERAIEEPNVSTTLDSGAVLPSTSSKPINTNDASQLISSPFKDLKSAILTILSPTPSSSTQTAVTNSKKPRKRVQHTAGEVITEAEVVERFHKEELERFNKKKIHFGSQDKVKRNQKRKVQSSKETENRKKSELELLPGKWVLIEYKGKKSTKTFVGQIMQIDSEDIHVKYVTKSTIGDFYVFPEKENIDIVEKTDVIKVLDDPLFNNREQYYFKILKI